LYAFSYKFIEKFHYFLGKLEKLKYKKRKGHKETTNKFKELLSKKLYSVCETLPYNIIVSDGTADVVVVVYVNIVTWFMGCVGVGEVAKGELSIANQGQEWMGIRTASKIAGSPSK
jgi:hypothetical protein